MIKCFYDIHIHSCLSSCADDLMTLHNIVNMSQLKGLDIIAITDHNSAKNCRAFMEIAKDSKLLAIPGIEVETYEGIHMLCYFRTLNDILVFDKILYKNLPWIENSKEIFGEQIVLDVNDKEIGQVPKMLSSSSNIKLSQLISLVHLFKGIVIPAHIDKGSNSLISILGFIPEHLALDGLEVSKKNHMSDYRFNEFKKKYNIIQNSDAHYIADICEKVNYIKLKSKTIDGFFEYFGDNL